MSGAITVWGSSFSSCPAVSNECVPHRAQDPVSASRAVGGRGDKRGAGRGSRTWCQLKGQSREWSMLEDGLVLKVYGLWGLGA